MNDNGVIIELTPDQALVLSNWLYDVMMNSDQLSTIVSDRAVCRRCTQSPARSTRRCQRSSQPTTATA
ncbi:hypothetical protein ACQPXM_03445 [Kribbella sp. CA-253562]|uniref:hypothetical protein n=1 Tax=Kribbella sp. CA-253562 TaxID=3239942 RepID=UPI003D8D6EB0